MQQLNNTNTGEVILIEKSKDNSLFYNIFENGYYAKKNLFGVTKQTTKRDTNIVPDIALNEVDLIQYTSELRILETELGYVLSDDFQNWLRPLRPLRLILTNDFLTSTLLLNNGLAKIILRKIVENDLLPVSAKFVFKGITATVCYFNEIDSDDAPIILPYILSGIVIKEDKNG